MTAWLGAQHTGFPLPFIENGDVLMYKNAEPWRIARAREGNTMGAGRKTRSVVAKSALVVILVFSCAYAVSYDIDGTAPDATVQDEPHGSEVRKDSALNCGILERMKHLPPSGDVSRERLREVLKEGFAKDFQGSVNDADNELVDSTLKGVSLLAGPGPYRLDLMALEEHLPQQIGEDLALLKTHPESKIDTKLAVAIVLSMYCTATPDDQDLLRKQLLQLADEVTLEKGEASPVDERGFPLITKEYIHRVTSRHLDKYIMSPLWPMLKYPLQSSELAELAEKFKERSESLGGGETVTDSRQLEYKRLRAADALGRRAYTLVSIVTSIRMPEIVGCGNCVMYPIAPVQYYMTFTIPNQPEAIQELRTSLCGYFIFPEVLKGVHPAPQAEGS